MSDKQYSNRVKQLTRQLLGEASTSISEADTAYQKFFRSALKKFGVDQPDKLADDKKKEFYNYVDKNWDAGKNETDVDEAITEPNKKDKPHIVDPSQQKIEKVKKSTLEAITPKLMKLTASHRTIQKELNKLHGRVNALQHTINLKKKSGDDTSTFEKQLKKTQNDIDVKQKELSKLQSDIESQKKIEKVKESTDEECDECELLPDSPGIEDIEQNVVDDPDPESSLRELIQQEIASMLRSYRSDSDLK